MYSHDILIFINEVSVRHLKLLKILEVEGVAHHRPRVYFLKYGCTFDLHKTHGGVPSHVSQDLLSLLSFVQPVHEVEARDAPFLGRCPHGKNTSGFSVLRFLSRYQV
jgi:hypothetical protein